jgi:hypothetical protein
LLCCGYKEGIPQSSTNTSSRQSTIFYSMYYDCLAHVESCLTVTMVQAGKSLVRSENVSDALWRGISNETCRDADYLFKLIGKAYAMLSDATMVCITEF